MYVQYLHGIDKKIARGGVLTHGWTPCATHLLLRHVLHICYDCLGAYVPIRLLLQDCIVWLPYYAQCIEVVNVRILPSLLSHIKRTRNKFRVWIYIGLAQASTSPSREIKFSSPSWVAFSYRHKQACLPKSEFFLVLPNANPC